MIFSSFQFCEIFCSCNWGHRIWRVQGQGMVILFTLSLRPSASSADSVSTWARGGCMSGVFIIYLHTLVMQDQMLKLVSWKLKLLRTPHTPHIQTPAMLQHLAKRCCRYSRGTDTVQIQIAYRYINDHRLSKAKGLENIFRVHPSWTSSDPKCLHDWPDVQPGVSRY